MYKYILFDLDGTLTDSAPGIIRCCLLYTSPSPRAAADRILPENLRHDCRRSKYGP
mgnify:CR=1 FL=1